MGENMEDLNQIIAENIQKLRKSKGMTQIDLANKLNYSDKAISKWERGDSLPDITMLVTLAKIFDVDLDFLVSKHTDEEINPINKQKFPLRNFLILIMLCTAVVFIAIVIFIYPTLRNPEAAKKYWIAFVSIVPVCSLLTFIYAKREKHPLTEIISLSLFIWSLITTVFCITIISGLENFWMLFLVGIPIQAAIFLYTFFKKTK